MEYNYRVPKILWKLITIIKLNLVPVFNLDVIGYHTELRATFFGPYVTTQRIAAKIIVFTCGLRINDVASVVIVLMNILNCGLTHL